MSTPEQYLAWEYCQCSHRHHPDAVCVFVLATSASTCGTLAEEEAYHWRHAIGGRACVIDDEDGYDTWGAEWSLALGDWERRHEPLEI